MALMRWKRNWLTKNWNSNKSNATIQLLDLWKVQIMMKQQDSGSSARAKICFKQLPFQRITVLVIVVTLLLSAGCVMSGLVIAGGSYGHSWGKSTLQFSIYPLSDCFWTTSNKEGNAQGMAGLCPRLRRTVTRLIAASLLRLFPDICCCLARSLLQTSDNSCIGRWTYSGNFSGQHWGLYWIAKS